MSSTDSLRTLLRNLDRLPSKRKLEDYDSFAGDDDAAAGASYAVSRKNANSRGKSVVETNSTVRNFSRGESSTQSNGDCSRTQVQFFVRMISGGKTLVFQANLKDTVEKIHQKINSVTGIPVIEQRLIYNGKQLQWEQTLEDCSVQNDAGLQLVGRMRSTGHPRAWRVINDMVSSICGICRGEIPTFSSSVVKGKLEQYMALPLSKPLSKFASFIMKNTRMRATNDTKELTNDDDDDDDDEEEEEEEEEVKKGKWKDENEGSGNIKKTDYCKIFMDACAPQALVMLYMSPDKRNQDCAEACIRSFVSFLKDLGGIPSESSFYATVVLEFCRLLRPMGAEDNGYLFCRSTLGSMLLKTEVVCVPKDIHGISERGTVGIGMQDVLPFFKELGQLLLKDLVLSAECNVNIAQMVRDVSDFSAFLQPVIVRVAVVGAFQKAKGRVGPLSEEDDYLFNLFNELLDQTDKCLSKLELPPAVKKEKEPKINHCGWVQYLTVLKILSSISMLYPGSEDQFLTVMTQNKEAVCQLVLRCSNRLDDYTWLHKYKDIMNFEVRRHLAMLMFPEVKEDYDELLEMLIDRSQLLSESFEYISSARPSALHAGLFMEFKDEDATGPGVLREWFCLLCQAIFDPQNALFVACPLDRRRFFPNPASKVDPLHLRYFRFSGRIIALALMHKVQVGVVLDRVFFLQLAGSHISLEDIQDADPCMYNSCKQILEMNAELVDSDVLGLTFVNEVEEFGSRRVLELCPGGKGIVVNSQNRKEYVSLIVKHKFVQRITEQVSSFAQGFDDMLFYGKVRETFFRSLELEDLDMMLHGSENQISMEDWKAHTDYDSYRKSDPQIVWFWEVLSQLNAEQKRTLLFFWTSVKYLPVEGFRGLASRLSLFKSPESQEKLPSSHTCFYRIYIPVYPSKAIMEDRLRVVTQEHVGYSFGTW